MGYILYKRDIIYPFWNLLVISCARTWGFSVSIQRLWWGFQEKMKVWGLPNPQRRLNNLPSILWEIDPLSPSNKNLQEVVFGQVRTLSRGCEYWDPRPPCLFCWWFFKRGSFFPYTFQWISSGFIAPIARSVGAFVLESFWDGASLWPSTFYQYQEINQIFSEASPSSSPWLLSINFDDLIRNHLAMYISNRSIYISTPWNFNMDTEKRDGLEHVPSLKLTYHPKKSLLKIIFLFSRWDIWVSWRVFHSNFKPGDFLSPWLPKQKILAHQLSSWPTSCLRQHLSCFPAAAQTWVPGDRRG